jgi:hypothetical protein
MARYLLVNVKRRVIDNIVEWNGDAEYNVLNLPGYDLIKDIFGASPGWRWDGEKAFDPNTPATMSHVVSAPKGGVSII